MEIGVIGINQYAQVFCKHWIKRGHKILFADLHLYAESYTLAEGLGSQVTLTLPEKVARQAEIIVIAVSPNNLKGAIRSLGHVQQKIVVDLVIEEPFRTKNEISTFHQIQQLLPEAKVVKITRHYPYHLFILGPDDSETLYSFSNDHLAQRMFRWVTDGSGYKMIDVQNGVH